MVFFVVSHLPPGVKVTLIVPKIFFVKSVFEYKIEWVVGMELKWNFEYYVIGAAAQVDVW